MGGFAIPPCPRATWRGVTVCKHMVPKLDRWAELVGQAIYIDAIQGSYSWLAASAGTHGQGGAIDVEMDPYTNAQARHSADCAREAGLLAWARLWAGNHHVHALDPDCPNLAPEAVDQFEALRANRNGLANRGKDDASRVHVPAIMAAFDRRLDVVAPSTGGKHRTYTIPKGGTLGAAALALGVAVGALAGYNGIADPNVVRPGQVVTAPPPGYVPPVAPAKPAPAKPAPAKPVPAKPSSPSSSGFSPIPGQSVVYPNLLKAGQTNSTSVYLYERALQRRGWISASYVDGFYGTETSAATLRAYRALGVSPVGTTPGPYLLRVLGLGQAGSSPSAKAQAAPVAASSSSFRPIASQKGVYTSLLKAGKSNSTSVYRYESALSRAGHLSGAYVDGFYGTATSSATKAAYRKLGVTPNATEPGPYLLKVLGVAVIR